MNRDRRAIPAVLILVCAGVVVGCAGPGSRTSEALDAAQDRRIAQQLAAERPYDEDARDDLAVSEARLARELASEACEALDSGLIYAGHRWAQMAAQLDARYADLEAEARRAVAENLLHDAVAAAEADYPSNALRYAERAAELDPTYDEAREVASIIRDRQAERYIDEARAAANQGDLESALLALRRAAEYRPDDPRIASLESELRETSRRRAFERLARQADEQIASGRLAEAEATLQQLNELNIDDDTLADLTARFLARRDRSRELIEQSDAALRRGDYDAAIEALQQAATLDRGLDVNAFIREARLEQARNEFMGALESGDRLAALVAARELLAIGRDPEVERMLPQLADEVVTDTLEEAERLHKAGETDDAIDLLERTLEHIDAPLLQARLQHYRALPTGGEDSAG